MKDGYASTPITSTEEFKSRVGDALAKVRRLSELSEEELKKKKSFKKSDEKTELKQYYEDLLLERQRR